MDKGSHKERLMKAIEAWDKIRRMVLSVEDGYRAIQRCFSCEGEDIMAAHKGCTSDIRTLLKMMDEYRPLLHEFVSCHVWLRIETLAEQLYDIIRMAHMCVEELLRLGNEANMAYYQLRDLAEGEGNK
jgi:hypothetical protein